MTWTPEQLLARADLLDRVSEGSKNAEYLDTLRMEAWALRRAAETLSTPAIEAWKIIEVLRAPEGAEVTLICDNPDFNGQPNSAIDVCDDWTGWETKRFAGDTVLDALRTAYLASRHGQQPEQPPMSCAQFEDNLKRCT